MAFETNLPIVQSVMYASGGVPLIVDPSGVLQVTGSAPIGVLLPQSLDSGNSITIDSSTITPWIGTWSRTRSSGIVRQLVVIASTVSSGLGGSFTFEFGEDGVNATISEQRTIGDFETMRDFDLINAGEYFRVKFTPSRSLTPGELIFITTTQRRQNDGSFVRLANQEIEEQNAAMGQVFSYLKAFNVDTGKSVNVRPALHGVDVNNRMSTPLTNGPLKTFTGGAGTTITCTGHGLSVGDAVRLTSTGLLPAPLASTTTTGAERIYWVLTTPTADTLTIGTAYNGTAVTMTDAGAGVHSLQQRGQFVGTFKDVSQIGSLLDLFFSDVKPATLRIEWSDDGTTQNTDLLAQQDLTTSLLTGFYLALNVRNTMVASYSRFRIVNGPSDMGATSGLISFIGREAFNGSYAGLDSSLSILSTALLTRAVLAGRKASGDFANLAVTPNKSLFTSEEGSIITSAGSKFSEGIRDDINHDFSVSSAADVASLINLGSIGGTVTHDLLSGGVVFGTGPTAGNTCVFRSMNVVNYSDTTGHGILGDQTIVLLTTASITGSAYVEWGFGDGGTNGFGFGYDVSGSYVFLKKLGTYTIKTYQTGWNGDKCDGGQFSEFTRNGTPETLRVDRNNLYRMMGEFLYAAEQSFYVKRPRGPLINVHTNEYPNLATVTSLPNANLPLNIVIHNDPVVGGDIQVRCGSWRAGVFTNSVTQIGLNPNLTYTDARAPGIHSGNSSTSILSASGIFRGTWLHWQGAYTGLTVDLKSDVSGTLFIDFSEDVSPVDGDDSSVDASQPTGGYAYDPATNVLFSRTIPVRSKWARVRYINGAAAQSEFVLDTAFLTAYPGPTIRQIDVAPTEGSFAASVTAVTLAKDSAGNNFDFVRTTTNSSGKKGLNTNVTKVEDDLLLRPMGNVRTSQAFIGTTAVQVANPALSNRRAVTISNDGRTTVASRVFLGVNSSVGTSPGSNAGFCMPVGRVITFRANQNVPLWLVCEDIGGASQTNTLSGTTASGTADNVNNAIVSDSTYCNLTASNKTVTVQGYALAGTLDHIQTVKLGIKANRSGSLFEQVAHQATVTGNAGNVGTVSTSTSVSAVSGNFYVAAVSRESAATVTSITGLGLTWVQVATQQSDDGKRTVDVWRGSGTPGSSGVVTANFSATATNSHIAVSSFNNVDASSPVTAFNGSNGNSSSPSVSVASSTANGLAYGAVAKDNSTFTQGAGFIEQSDEVSSSGTVDGLATETKQLAAGGSQTVNGTLSAAKHWALIGVTLQPQPALTDQVTVSYAVSGVTGATSGSALLSSTTDTTTLVDVSADRVWLFTDIANVSITAAGTLIGAAPAKIDQLFLQVVESSTNSTYVSVMEVAE